MELPPATFAWEPFTPRGVASFARASLGRLLVVESLFALLVAALVVWLLAGGFFPTVTGALRALPDSGGIDHGTLTLPNTTPHILAEGHFLEFNIDLDHSGQTRSPAQFQFEFGRNSLAIFSFFGEADILYPADQSFYFNRQDLLPLWGAWSPEILGLAALAAFLGLLLSWSVLATVYLLPVWLAAFFANRDLNFRQSWRLAGAALMPGALLMSLALWLYGAEVFDMIKFGFAFGMHFVIGWIYLFVSVWFLPRATPSPGKNPFGGEKKDKP
jgi:hypothetical protein